MILFKLYILFFAARLLTLLNFRRSGKHKNERKRALANPDFVERLKTEDAQLIEPGRTTFYGGDSKGYIDYPLLKSNRGRIVGNHYLVI